MIAIASVLTLTLLIFFSQLASAQIGVDNDGPSFTDITIMETDELIFVNVGVRDLNGWTDIFAVNVTIYDDQNRIISQVNFTQYSNLTTDIMFSYFNQTEGDNLNQEFSTHTYVEIAPWNPDNAIAPIGLRVTFAFDKFAGDHIYIVCTDRGENPLSCEHSGPFSAEYIPPPKFDDVAIPITLSSVVATGGALFMAYRRFKNNQLARAVETNEGGN